MLQSDALYSWMGNVEFKRELNDKFEKEVVGFFEIISEEKTIYIELALIKQGIGKSINSFSKICNSNLIQTPNHRKKIRQIAEKYFAKSPKKLTQGLIFYKITMVII